MWMFFLIGGLFLLSCVAMVLKNYRVLQAEQFNGETYVTVQRLKEKGYTRLQQVPAQAFAEVNAFLVTPEGTEAMEKALKYLRSGEGKKQALEAFREFGVPEQCFYIQLLL